MNEIKFNKELLLTEHQGVASHTRETLKFLMKSLANATTDEEEFFASIAKSDKAALVLQRANSALSNLIGLEQNLLERQLELESKTTANHNITRHDCELVISLVRGWGLLRDDCDEAIEKIIDYYETKQGDHQ